MTSSEAAGRRVPWYRDRWPWLLAAGPAIAVVGGLATAWIAVASDDGLVADDYYKRGLAINRVLEREARAEALDVGAVVVIAADGAVRVELSGAQRPAPAAVRLRLVHPTRAGRDVAVVLDRSADGAYAGRVESPTSGRWLVSVEADAWRLPSVEAAAPGEARLGAERAAR